MLGLLISGLETYIVFSIKMHFLLVSLLLQLIFFISNIKADISTNLTQLIVVSLVHFFLFLKKLLLMDNYNLHKIFRHGPSAPLQVYPKDIYDVSDWSKYGGLG